MRFALIAVFILFSFLSIAQNVLLLEIQRPFKLKQKRFYPKEEIALKLKGSSKIYRGKIVAIGDSALILTNKKSFDTIVLKKVSRVIVYRSNHVTRVFTSAFAIVGFGLIFIDTFNNTLNHESPLVKPNIVITGLSIAAAGLLLKLYEKKRYRLNKRKRLRVTTIVPY